jgi:hypothetical protein
MSWKAIIAVVAVAGFAGACQTIPKEQTVGQYCADASNANKDVCKINIEIEGTRKSLAQTDLKLSEARAIADQAVVAAAAAKDQMFCETRTLNKTTIGTCSPGYSLVSCTQSRYTYRAGGPSILREVDDKQCRFNDRVLEMKVRCCMAGNQAAPTEQVLQTPAPKTQPAKTQPTS